MVVSSVYEHAFIGVRSPEGSESSRKNSDASPDITRTLPRKQRELFMRLQQRVQQSNNKLADMESETEPLSAESQDEDGLRLKIEEPESSGTLRCHSVFFSLLIRPRLFSGPREALPNSY